MKPSGRLNILIFLGALCMLADALQKPLGLPGWTAFTLPAFGAVFIWCGIWLARRAKRRRDPSLAQPVPLWRRKSRVVLLIVSFAAGIAYAAYDIAQFTQTRAIDRQLKAVADASRALPPGLGQFEDMAERLRQIQPGWATPHQVKQALADYTTALQSAVDAFKDIKDMKPYDQALEQAQHRLTAAIKDHWDP